MLTQPSLLSTGKQLPEGRRTLEGQVLDSLCVYNGGRSDICDLSLINNIYPLKDTIYLTFTVFILACMLSFYLECSQKF